MFAMQSQRGKQLELCMIRGSVPPENSPGTKLGARLNSFCLFQTELSPGFSGCLSSRRRVSQAERMAECLGTEMENLSDG